MGEGDHPHRASKDARLSTGYGVVEGAPRGAPWELRPEPKGAATC